MTPRIVGARGGMVLVIAVAMVPGILEAATSGDWFESMPSPVFAPGAWHGVACGDYDRDGDEDLFVTEYNGANRLYRNEGGGVFSDATAALPAASGQFHGCAFGDYDGDGWLDLYVGRRNGGEGLLYRNTRDGRFVLAGSEVLGGGAGDTASAAWADYDHDGDLDLFVTDLGGQPRLYQNQGGLRFLVVNPGGVFTPPLFATGCGWSDYDNDGDGDLLVASGGGLNNALFRNSGAGTFVAEQQDTIVKDRGYSTCTSWGDFDNDGDLDVFIANRGAPGFLYENRVPGSFVRIPDQPPATDLGESNGSAWADFDNDGDLDLFVSNYEGEPSRLYQNDGGGRFSRLPNALPSPAPSAAVGVGLADFTGDGFVDLFVTQNGGPGLLYRNRGTTNRWLKVRLGGTTLPDSVIGARVRVLASTDGVERWQMREIVGGDGWASTGFDACLGLGAANEATTVRVEWPSGQVDQFDRVSANQVLAVAAPPLTISPDGGTFVGSVEVRIRSAVPGTTIRFTQDGSDPTPTSPEYRDPITLTESAIIKARLYVNTFPASEVESATFTRLPAIVFEPPGGVFTNSVAVTLQNTLGVGALFFTLDGTAPTSSSLPYLGPLMLTTGVTVQARVFLNAFPISETVAAQYARAYAAEDTIPDAWQEAFFGPGYLTDPRAAANADPDADGWINQYEFEAQTDPTDPASQPEIRVGIQAVPKVTWNSIPGLTYRVLRKDRPDAPAWQVVLPAFVATETTSTHIDAEAPRTAIYVVELVK